jgi:hypothetical protein
LERPLAIGDEEFDRRATRALHDHRSSTFFDGVSEKIMAVVVGAA